MGITYSDKKSRGHIKRFLFCIYLVVVVVVSRSNELEGGMLRLYLVAIVASTAVRTDLMFWRLSRRLAPTPHDRAFTNTPIFT